MTKLRWVGKHTKYYHETDELPNSSQPNPRKKWLKKRRLGHVFPKLIIFRDLGLGFIWDTEYKRPKPAKILANTSIPGKLITVPWTTVTGRCLIAGIPPRQQEVGVDTINHNRQPITA